MQRTFIESGIRFEFDEKYNIIHSDDEVNVSKIKQFLQGTKDVDFWGFYASEILFFMEVTNYKGSTTIKIETLATEAAQKLRDTIAIIAGASRNTTNDEAFWQSLHSQIGNKDKSIKFVFWLEEDFPKNSRQVGRLKNITDNLKQKCKWLTTKIIVQNMENMRLDGLSVSYV